ncbi:MAG: hypothetical protein ACRD08_23250, partial [Acidimicrobiales bacterium]
MAQRYIDLSVTVNDATMSPPSTNLKVELTPHRRGPGFWQVSPDYFTQSPYFPPEAAQWLVDRGPKNIGFDFFEEYCARLPDFTSEDFAMHRVILGAGVVIMEG